MADVEALRRVEIHRFSPGERPFLLCIRAGQAPEYLQWLDFARARSWDLMLSYYAEPEGGFDTRAEYVVSGGLSKFTAFAELERQRPGFWRRYQAVALWDDDLETLSPLVDRLFAVMGEHGLQLAQPALTHDSPHSFEITRACPSFKLRFTNYVEVMAPIFSAEGLATCLPSFDQSVSSWGIDFLWTHLLGNPRDRIAVIDAVRVRHSKGVDVENGAFYRFLQSLGVDPKAEKARILQQYGLRDWTVQFGGVFSHRDLRGVQVRFVPVEPSSPAG